MTRTAKRTRMLIAFASLAVSLVFFLELSGYSTLLSSMSCEGHLSKNNQIVCLLRELALVIFGAQGVKILSLVLGVFMLYAGWYISPLNIKVTANTETEGSPLGNIIAKALGVTILAFILTLVVIVVINNA